MNRPISFILAACDHGSMILNRNDHHTNSWGDIGVGNDILTTSSYTKDEVFLLLSMLTIRRKHFGDGVVAIDGGANIGVHTIEWARHMHGWGDVLSFEAQEPIFYALAGNIALNNCFNAHAAYLAIGRERGSISIPRLDHTKPASFGSLELKQLASTEDIGQYISYDVNTDIVNMVSIDTLNLPRLDLLKLDVEGMEEEVLLGSSETIDRCHPIIYLEYLKSDTSALLALLLSKKYVVFMPNNINGLAVHIDDLSLDDIQKMFSTQGINYEQLTKKRITICEYSPGIGDVCMGLCTAHALADAGYSVTFVSLPQFFDLAASCVHVDTVSGVQESDEIWLSAAWNQCQKEHQINTYIKTCNLDLATVSDSSKQLELHIPQHTLDMMAAKYPGTNRIIIHPAGRVPSRTWPMAYWQELANKFALDGIEVVAIGMSNWMENSTLKLEGVICEFDLTPLETMALLQHCKVFIATDSGPIQFAGMSECGIVGLYSITKPEYRLPFRHGKVGWNSVGIQGPCDTPGCYTEMVENYGFVWKPKAQKIMDEVGLGTLIYNWCLNEGAPYSCMPLLQIENVYSQSLKLYLAQDFL